MVSYYNTGAEASLSAAKTASNNISNHHQHHHQRVGGEQHRLARSSTTLEDFAWTSSRTLTDRKYADAARLIGGTLALGWNGMEASNLEQRIALKSQLRKAGRNPMRNMGWSESLYNKK